jgi:hypothetical protein
MVARNFNKNNDDIIKANILLERHIKVDISLNFRARDKQNRLKLSRQVLLVILLKRTNGFKYQITSKGG